jgi:Domain of unknown function (DUF4145)
VSDATEIVSFKAKKADCSACGGERNCDILGDHDDFHSDDFMSWSTHWYLLRCRGCDHVFVMTVDTNSEDIDYFYEEDGSTGGTHTETLAYWPALSKRPLPDWIDQITVPNKDSDLLNTYLNELYGALNGDLNTLSAIGIRTSFDIAAELLGVNENKTFKEKLEALEADGHIGALDLERLETLIEAGNASAHRGWRPKAEDLDTLMEVLEHFIHDAFVAPLKKKRLDAKAAAVKGKVPARQRASRNNAAARPP